jgi:aspartate/methionine/tyrosine aminotransferase
MTSSSKEFQIEGQRRGYAYICGIAPTTILVASSMFFSLTAVATAVIDQRFWGDNGHFDFIEEMEIMADNNNVGRKL